MVIWPISEYPNISRKIFEPKGKCSDSSQAELKNCPLEQALVRASSAGDIQDFWLAKYPNT